MDPVQGQNDITCQRRHGTRLGNETGIHEVTGQQTSSKLCQSSIMNSDGMEGAVNRQK
jgi:hypothetical protein